MTAVEDMDGVVLSSGFVLKCEGTYANGRPSVVALGSCGPECSVTVNLPDEHLEDGQFFVRREAKKHTIVFRDLVEDGVARPTGRVVGSGFVPDYAEVWEVVQP